MFIFEFSISKPGLYDVVFCPFGFFKCVLFCIYFLILMSELSEEDCIKLKQV